MVPSGSLLAVPLSVTAPPAFTVWLGPALATGGTLGGGGGGGGPELLPPPLLQAERTASEATRVMPDKRVRILPYTGAAAERGVGICRQAAPWPLVWPDLCGQSRRLLPGVANPDTC